MRRLTERERDKEYKAIAQLRDEDIDYSDIPEITAEQWAGAVRGRFYRPIKRPVTMRLDADVIEWLKGQGPGYQTKANQLLRAQMLRSVMEGRKKPVKKKAGKKRAKVVAK